MASLDTIKELALHAVKGTAPTNYSVENVNEALAAEIKNMAGSYNSFRKNKFDIYEIVGIAADEVVPRKVMDVVAPFAEVQMVPQGQKAIFHTTKGRNRARKFLTQVGLSGVYETFRLDKDKFELSGHSVGGAITIDFERFLDGAESLPELMDIITEGLTDAVFGEIQKALRSAVNAKARQDNKTTTVIANQFDGDAMFKLVSTVRAYGDNVVIFAPPEFVAAMGADAIVPVGTNYPGVYHPQDIDAIHNTGYVNLFRGTPVVQIPQSFVDDRNETTWIDPQLAYVLPAGREKVVKIIIEGNTQVYDFENRDQSIEVHAYRKIGSAILTHYNWGIYQNTGITQTFEDEVYGF